MTRELRPIAWLRGYRRDWLGMDLVAGTTAAAVVIPHAKQGTTLWVAALPTRARQKARRTAAWSTWSVAGRVHPTVSAAVATYHRRQP